MFHEAEKVTWIVSFFRAVMWVYVVEKCRIAGSANIVPGEFHN